jgi:hypothetical protein
VACQLCASSSPCLRDNPRHFYLNPPPTGSAFSFQLLVIISDDPTSRPLEQRTKITTTTYGASNAQSLKSTNPTLKRNNSSAHAPDNPKLSSPFEQNLAGL